MRYLAARIACRTILSLTLLCVAAASGTKNVDDFQIKVQLMYDSTLAQYFGNATETAKYLSTFLQQVNTILAHQSLSRVVRLRLSTADNPPRQLSRADELQAGLSLLRHASRDRAVATTGSAAAAVLRRFCRLADAKRATRRLPDFGHAFLLVGASLPTLGISYRGGACWPSADCALLMVSRRRLFHIAFTAAHELGHSLRLGHQSGGGGGGGGGGAVMSDRLAADWPDGYRWTPESARQLRREIEEIEHRPYCIGRTAAKNVSRRDAGAATSDLPVWQADRVCQLVTDGALQYSQVPFQSMQCRMFCCRSSSSIASADCPVRVSAFNGVACGGGSRCQDGACAAPPTDGAGPRQQQPVGRWFVLPDWTPCSVTCGRGTRSRRLQCGLRRGFGFAALPSDRCSGEAPPRTRVTECRKIADCPTISA